MIAETMIFLKFEEYATRKSKTSKQFLIKFSEMSEKSYRLRKDQD